MFEQKYDADQVPWSIQQTFTGIFFTIVPWVLLSFALSRGGSAPSVPLSSQADWTNAVVTFLFDVAIEATFLIAPYYFASRAFRTVKLRMPRILNALGFRRFHVGQALLLVVALFVGIYALNFIYQYLIDVLHLHLQTNDQVLLRQGKNAPITTYATLVVAVLVAPLCEEVFFRSFVFVGLRTGMPPGVSVVLSALIFAVAHADFGSFLVLLFIGLALAFVRLRTHSIWPGILLHMLNNGVSAVLLLLALQGVIN